MSRLLTQKGIGEHWEGLQALCRLAYAAAGVKGRQAERHRAWEHRPSAGLLQSLPACRCVSTGSGIDEELA